MAETMVAKTILVAMNLPEWAQYVAVDDDGVVWVYGEKPNADEEMGDWTNGDHGKSMLIGKLFGDVDWRNSLATLQTAATPTEAER